MNTKRLLTLILTFSVVGIFNSPSFAEGYKGKGDLKPAPKVQATQDESAGCLPPTEFKYLDINNVRTRINTAGDMWYDGERGNYEIPKGSGRMANYSASLWMGGVDVNNQLKLAAQMFRYGPGGHGGTPKNKMDFWTGPISIDGSASVDKNTCKQYDKLFEMTRKMVDDFTAAFDAGGEVWEAYKTTMPREILEWPAHGDVSKNQSPYLAPFFDRDKDGHYDPMQGDYPYYDLTGDLCNSDEKIPTMEELFPIDPSNPSIIPGSSMLSDQVIKGDQTLWWVFNDKGNAHDNTQGAPIGVEVRAQAFAFATNDEVNNMTFYSYEIINRSTYVLKNTYFSQWLDVELGFAEDDYIGCDVLRGLGYCYNGKDIDGSGQSWAYGANPPAVGIDFFQGPYIDPDGKDNDKFTGDNCHIFNFNLPEGNADDGSAINGVNFGDGIVDNERFGMRRFVYHNNPGNAAGPYMNDPKYAIQYYNLLRGIWLDNSKMVYGGNGHTSAGGYGPDCAFMFPGDTDPCDWGTRGITPNPKNWTEETAGNKAADRRIMQSAGPFTLKSGAVNYITVGIPWARAQQGGPWASVDLLKKADDKCQRLFESCFQVLNGPNAPDLTIQELDKKLIVYLTNRHQNNSGNNYKERYWEVDPSIVSPDSLASDQRYDSAYVFEGYKVYQLATKDVSVSELSDPDKAKLIFQCDVKNGVSRIVNYEMDEVLGLSVPKLKVDGEDNGIRHSFEVTEDAFTKTPLVNHMQYYFTAVSYAYNNFLTYNQDPLSQSDEANAYGQKNPYLEGRKNIQQYTGIPHKPISSTYNIVADYGDGVDVKRIQGMGNGGNYLKVDPSIYDELLSKPVYTPNMSKNDPDYPRIAQLKYQPGYAPIRVKVIDPLNVRDGNFVVVFGDLEHQVIENFTGKPGFVPGGDTVGIKAGPWYLKNMDTGEIFVSDTTIKVNNEQIFTDLGISIEINQCHRPGPYEIGKLPGTHDASQTTSVWECADVNNGFVGADIHFVDSTKIWFVSLQDRDISATGMEDWIRAGVNSAEPQGDELDMRDVELQLAGSLAYASDPKSIYESVLDGTWAPYKMVASSKQLPLVGVAAELSVNYSRRLAEWEMLHSVDIILTSDSTKWTRCPVLEMCRESSVSEGNALPFQPRKAPSVNVLGQAGVESSDPLLNSSYINETGMGWFPGFALDLETGERLNIAFGEDSYLADDNGRDMLWNPTSRVYDQFGNPVMGGKHYVYVFAADSIGKQWGTRVRSFTMPPYDAGNALRLTLDSTSFASNFPPPNILNHRDLAMATAMWVTIPLSNPSVEWLSTDAKVELRVNAPYDYYRTGDNTDYSDLSDINVNPDKGNPIYQISTSGVVPQPKSVEELKEDLNTISVVPNPYYGYSRYDQNQLDNRVKFINLPESCTVTIYNVSGTLVRQFTKSDPTSQLDWDLKNFSGIPISGGVYYIHIDAPGKGQQVIKWFGMLRPIDLNAF